MRRYWKSFLVVLVAVTLIVALGLPHGQAIAKKGIPKGERPPKSTASLEELQRYYGVLKDINGQVGVVVELVGQPAARLYADELQKGVPEPQARARAATQVQSLVDQQKTFLRAVRAQGIRFTELYRTQRVYNGIWMYLKAKDVAKLAALPGVKALHPIIPKEIEHTTSVPLIGALQAWSNTTPYQGDGIKVGIIDTGIDYLHADFGGPGNPAAYTTQDFTVLGDEDGYFGPGAPKVVGGYDFAGDDYDASNNSVPHPDPDPMDCQGHGTHVAGTVAGFGVLADGTTYVEDPDTGDTYANLVNLSQDDYIAKFSIGPGVAPKAQLYALRVFGCQGSTDLVTEAIEWAMDPNGDGDFSDHLDVINMSLGSIYGSEYDPDSVAANNAALAGIIVVAAAGNSGDNFYITGSPAVAHSAISVASTKNPGAVLDAFKLTQDTSNTLSTGLYPAKFADFGPTTFDVTADLVYADPADGCDTITNDVSGKIALIDRGSCYFTTKVQNAESAGAVGVIVVNNQAGFPITMGGSANTNIPAVMTDQDTGNDLKTALNNGGTVTVRLYDGYRNAIVKVDTSIQDEVSSFSSRGPARVTNQLKPDIAAPGEMVFSAAALTGNQGVSFEGTSMATPHVAGAMALLREEHPTWSVAQLKALVMDTAYLVSGIYTPSRVGAGRVAIADAMASPVIAYNGDDPATVSVSFGAITVPITGTKTLTKPITLENFGSSDLTYDISFDSRYENNPGLTFDVVDSGMNSISSITVPAGGQATVYVKVTVNPASLTKAADPNLNVDGYRQYFSEGGGYVLFTANNEPDLHVPVYIAARPGAMMDVVDNALPLDGSGTVGLTLAGVPVPTSYDAGGLGSLLGAFELLYQSPNEVTTSGPANAADLKYVGATYDSIADTLYFAVSTYGNWNSPAPYDTEFDIYIDVNEDGTYDYVLFNHTPWFDDEAVTYLCNLATNDCSAEFYINGLPGGYDTALFNNNVMVLPVGGSDLGLDLTNNSDFNFWMVTWNREYPSYVDITPVLHYNIAQQVFEGGLFYDQPGRLTIPYNPAVLAQNGTDGLLVLHFHNTLGATAEVIPLDAPKVTAVNLLTSSPTNASTIYYEVRFSGPVTGVDVNDFTLTTTGSITGAAVSNVTQEATGVYRVAVNTGSGKGTIRLDISASATITDPNGQPLVGVPYTEAQPCTIVGIDDFGVYNSSKGLLTLKTVTGAQYANVWLASGAVIVTGDFNGDGKDDIGVYKPGEGAIVQKGADGRTIRTIWVAKNATPVVGDWDGDGVDDFGVYNSSKGLLTLKTVTGAQYANVWLASGAVIVTGDFNGDGKDDIGVYKPGEGAIVQKGADGRTIRTIWVAKNATPVVGDWDGDGVDDFGVYSSSKGLLTLKTVTGAQYANVWLASGAVIVTGDFNGDGKDDIGVYKPGEGAIVQKGADGRTIRTIWVAKNATPVVGDWDGR